MKIRVMGTQEECKQAQEYYRQFATNEMVGYCSVSDLYPNRGSVNQYRVYIDIAYKTDYGQVMQSTSLIKAK